jgi:hypothetical protein
VHAIGSKGHTILNSAQTINGSARSILSSGNSILSRVNSIDKAVANIVTGLASPIDTTAQAIKQDFIGIDARVGQEGRSGAFASTVVGHANSIDCSLPVGLLGGILPKIGLKLGSTGCHQ